MNRTERIKYDGYYGVRRRAIARYRKRRKITLVLIVVCLIILVAIVAYGVGYYQGQREGGIFLTNTVYTGLGERAVGL
ncbi:MAG: hypothetical protein PHP22_03545 [Oscillospiraceae bacterium]|nr:hypothetical protein [Oscillospiraceae bacterium]